MESKTLEQQLKEKEKQIEELKKRLEARNTSFNENLQNKSDSIFNDLKKNIAQAIINSVGNNLIHAFKYEKMYLDYESSLYGQGGWRIRFVDQKSEKDIKQKIADQEMRKFQESLDNFSWAVQQNRG